MNLLDLFSGIGAFSLGLERSGAFRTVAFCEIDPFCRRVLAKHWPEVPCYDDVRSITAEQLRADGISVDAICGGFPCQDISVAGRGAGIGGERSGLWSEFARIIGELRPQYVFVENVAALLGRGLGTVLGDLAAIGFDAEWHCIPAAAVGAPHIRDRVWIVAYPQHPNADEFRSHRAGMHQHAVATELRDQQERVAGSVCADVSNASGEGRREVVRGAYGDEGEDGAQHLLVAGSDGAQRDVADTIGLRELQQDRRGTEERRRPSNGSDALANTTSARQSQSLGSGAPILRREALEPSGSDGSRRDHWLSEPDVGRVAHGVPARVDRLKSLGNSLVPQIAELIGRAVAAQHKERAA